MKFNPILVLALILAAGSFFSCTQQTTAAERKSGQPLVKPHEEVKRPQLTEEDRNKLRNSVGRDVKVVNLRQFRQMLQNPSDTLYIFNFWATWCKPCIEEMPHFDNLQKDVVLGKNLANYNMKVVFVSLDNPKLMEKKVLPFIKENRYISEVVLLDAGEPDVWINEVSKDWTGSIPATLFLNNADGLKLFYEQEFVREQELRAVVQPLLLKHRTADSD